MTDNICKLGQTTDSASILHAALREARLEPVCVDASDVKAPSLASAQILLAAISEKVPFTLRGATPDFIESWQDLGLDPGSLPRCADESAAVSIPSAAPDPSGDLAPDVAGDAVRTRILTIDDSRTIRQMLMLALDGAGFEVFQAEDGEEGIAMLASTPVDVVITDINMPRLDGYGVIRHMRAEPAHLHTPILVLTTESEVSKKELARDIGATGWVVKPFDPERLVDAIHQVTLNRKVA
jgi:two-component system chemotaxis response regulator CheY